MLVGSLVDHWYCEAQLDGSNGLQNDFLSAEFDGLYSLMRKTCRDDYVTGGALADVECMLLCGALWSELV